MSTNVIRFLACVIPGTKQIMVRNEHLNIPFKKESALKIASCYKIHQLNKMIRKAPGT